MKKTEELAIENLLNENKYIIPYYQRNYAWEFTEIHQLLSDIKDCLDKKDNLNTENSYYLGVLVVSEKEVMGDIFYEIVDGQQRHTTLSIIHSVLSENKENNRNLYFEARKENEDLLDMMFGHKESNEFVGSSSFYKAKQIIEQFLNDNKANQDKFRSFFYKNVKIFRVILPNETDLNHYFEIMNNRGEQLEQHEILKARLMDKIKNPQLQQTFSVLWDACSDMNGFVIQKTPPSYRVHFFGDDYLKIPNLYKILSYKDYINNSGINSANKNDFNTEEEDKWNINTILKKHSIATDFNQKNNDIEEFRFSSVIDFPNFLLQALKISHSDVKLDDKFLLTEFDKINSEEKTLLFLERLIQTRVLFDNYIIKRDKSENNWNWSLLRYTANSDHPFKFSLENKDIGKSLKMLQSMYHVTFTSNNYKNWLYDFLNYLAKNQIEGYINDLLLLNYSENKAIQRFKENGDVYCKGLNTPRFVFNFIDYLLWKEYFTYVRGSETNNFVGLLEKIFKCRSKFHSFKFVQRNSIEHLFPQSRIFELNDSEESKVSNMNCIGNLCLVSTSVNSSLNNHLPYQKKHDSRLKKTNESLKQQIMFESFNSEIWNVYEIKKHHEEIIKLLEKYGCKS